MTEIKAIGTVYRTRLSNSAHVSMNAEIALRMDSLSIADSKISPLQSALKACIAKEQECVNRIMKSATTEELEQQDVLRDTTFRFLTNVVLAYTLCPDEETRLAAKRLEAIFSAYHSVYLKAYSEETAGIDGLLADLGSETAKADIKLIHLEAFVLELERENKWYKNLDEQRTSEYMTRVKTETAQARKATDEALDTVIRRVNAMQELEPTELTATFINAVNQIYKKYSDLIAAKAAKKKPDTPIV